MNKQMGAITVPADVPDHLRQSALVTGGAGFIGSHLTEHLLAHGWRVRVLDDLSAGRLENLAAVADKIEFISGSVTDAATVERAVAGVDVIFHLAAKVFVPESFEKPAEYERVNVHGTSLLLEAAKRAKVRRVVLSSTCAVYGDATAMPIAETAPPRPLSPYAANKHAAEELGRKAAEHGLGFTALRYFNVYGVRQDPRSAYSGVISRFADALKNGRMMVIHGDGSQTRDFIHVSDVVRANRLAAEEREPAFTVYNVGTGRETSILRLHTIMSLILNSTAPAQHQPGRPGEIIRSVADINRISTRLNFQAQALAEERMRELLATT